MRFFTYTFYCLFILNCSLSMAQEVIATSGMFGTHSTGSLSITIGETMTETATSNSGILTQGFQQNYESILALPENEIDAILLYPNPFTTHFFVEGDFEEGARIFIYDVSFRLIEQKTLNSGPTCQMDIGDKASSEYFIYLSQPDQLPRFIGKLIHTIP